MSNVLKPKKLKVGDTIGVVASSQPVLDMEGYKRGCDILRQWGFNLKEGKTLRMQKWWMAGTPEDQAKEINSMYTDKDIKAIIAQAGGASAIKVLPFLDYETIRRNPKPFIGMSDNNAYHLAMYSKVKLAGFHLEDVALCLGYDGWSKEERECQKKWFLKALTSSEPIGKLEGCSNWECWRDGEAEGKLIGGNLNVFCLLMGTPYFPEVSEFDGAILFWEDISKELHVIDQMLYKLRLAGIFDRISGMLIGVPTGFKEKEYADVAPSFKNLVLEAVEGYDFPIMAEMDFGHSTINLPLVMGLNAKMVAGERTLYITESACVD